MSAQNGGTQVGTWVRAAELGFGALGLLLTIVGLGLSFGRTRALSPRSISALLHGAVTGNGTMIVALGLLLLLLTPVVGIITAVAYGVLRQQPRTALVAALALIVIVFGTIVR